jgi:hypothetical protein
MVMIYGLVDPATPDAIRYVGKANDPATRLREHIYDAVHRGTRTWRARWIRHLLNQGRSPAYTMLEAVSDSEWQDAERRWINDLRADGHRLTNIAPGGEGGPMPQATRDKISATTKGRPSNTTGKHLSLSTRQKMSVAHEGRVSTPESRARMSAAQKGRLVSSEHRAKISATMKAMGIGPSDANRRAHGNQGRVKGRFSGR